MEYQSKQNNYQKEKKLIALLKEADLHNRVNELSHVNLTELTYCLATCNIGNLDLFQSINQEVIN